MEYQLLTPSIPAIEDFTPVEQVFMTRGMHPKDINHYLNTTIEDILDPALLDNIDDGAKMLIKHLALGDKIFV
jgi:hypothetical protein